MFFEFQSENQLKRPSRTCSFHNWSNPLLEAWSHIFVPAQILRWQTRWQPTVVCNHLEWVKSLYYPFKKQLLSLPTNRLMSCWSALADNNLLPLSSVGNFIVFSNAEILINGTNLPRGRSPTMMQRCRAAAIIQPSNIRMQRPQQTFQNAPERRNGAIKTRYLCTTHRFVFCWKNRKFDASPETRRQSVHIISLIIDSSSRAVVVPGWRLYEGVWCKENYSWNFLIFFFLSSVSGAEGCVCFIHIFLGCLTS